MRRLYKVLFIIFLVCLGLLVLYALPMTRPWMETNIGPPLMSVGGGIFSGIVASAPVQFLLANPLLIAIIFLILGICPISFPIIHGAFNKHRAWFVRSSDKESGRIIMTEPRSVPMTTVAAPTSTPAPATTPAPAPAPKPEPVSSPPPAEKKSEKA